MNTKETLLLVFILMVSVSLVTGCSDSQPGHHGYTTHSNALNPEKVPEDLRALIPLAEKWGLGDGGLRGDVIAAATPAERVELESVLARYDSQISAWIDSFGDRDMTDEAAAFMFMQIAAEEFDIP